MDLQSILSDIGGGQALQDAAAKIGVSPDDAQNMLSGVLEHATQGGGVEGMAEAVAGKAGVDPALVQQFLPQIMTLLQAHADGAPEGAQAGLGGLMGAVGGLLGGASSGQGGGLGGLMGMAQGLFGKKE